MKYRIVNKTKISLELKAAKLWINSLLEKERNILSDIQPSFNKNNSSSFGRGCSKLTRTKKNQQSTYKARKHNVRKLFLQALVLLTRASTGVVSTPFYCIMYPLFITLTRYLHQLPLFASASITNRFTATDRVCLHHR